MIFRILLGALFAVGVFSPALAEHGTPKAPDKMAYIGQREFILKVSEKEKQAAIAFWEAFANEAPAFKGKIGEVNRIAEKTSFDLVAQAEKTELEILYLLSLTERGKRLIRDLVPLELSGKAEVLSFSSAQGKALAEVFTRNRKDLPAGVYDVKKKKLFVNTSAPYTQLLGTFVHEAQHAVDGAALDPNWVIESRERVWFEHRGYRAQGVFVEQMRTAYKEFSEATDELEKNPNAVPYSLSELEFRDLMKKDYAIPHEAVDEHFEKHRWKEFN